MVIDILLFFFIRQSFWYWKFSDWFCFLGCGIVVMFVELDKCPLCPFVKFWISGIYFSIPIIGKSHILELLFESCYICCCGYGRIDFVLNGILFCWKSKCVPTHRMEDIVSLEDLGSCKDVSCDISFGMSNMESSS